MATIYCFTSTGNSLYTAKKIAEDIDSSVVPMKGDSVTCDDDVIGFVFPVFFWGMPRMVERFVSEMQITNKNAYIFAVATCGGSNFGSLGRLKKLISLKGARLRYGKCLVTITNYLPEYTIKDSEEKRKKIDGKLSTIIGEIQNREKKNVLHFTLVNRVAYRIMPGEDSDSLFTVTSDCTGCYTCQKICPAGNIAMVSEKPTFNHKCEHCLACLHACPVCAIDWKGKTQGKKRYRRDGISLNDIISFNSKNLL